jgi:hypothetical protein
MDDFLLKPDPKILLLMYFQISHAIHNSLSQPVKLDYDFGMADAARNNYIEDTLGDISTILHIS